ncbi:hypothetical protein BDW59DRAFT_175993 [Aspergillus cavernicola]|uniref:Dyp-type peroxidase n=1 Tax=Aspergillus cavernicola TaxID=176166 RepID=A0ABR4HJY5_9EURO
MEANVIDKNNVQGDIWPGIPKSHQILFFFNITNKDKFRAHLKNAMDMITTSEDAIQMRGRIRQHKIEVAKGNQEPSLLSAQGVNLSFTSKGLAQLGKHDLRAGQFDAGMKDDLRGGVAGGEGRDNLDDWEERFKNEKNDPSKVIHGVFSIGAQNSFAAHYLLGKVKGRFIGFLSSSIREVFTIEGWVRPGSLRGKEHFGFEDEISQPQLDGLDPEPEGDKEPKLVPPGIIINNAKGAPTPQPDWATEGSFFVFRKLQQYVPEFQNWLDHTAPQHYLTSDQLSARLVGRWKSGTPVCLAPLKDNPELKRNNNFDFTPVENQHACPFAAHIRKVRPRADFSNPDRNCIMRRSMTYGPELTDHERKTETTTADRGLLFMCFQSNIANGFRLIQEKWSNQDNFPRRKEKVTGEPGPGADAICGQPNPPDNFAVSICDGQDPPHDVRLKLESWVTPRGGEYFFTPSIKALKGFSA